MPRWTERDIPDQTGRIAVVTGANTGIGYETARALAAKGATVVLACRDPRKGDEATQRIRGSADGAQAESRALDLADLESVRAFAEQFHHPRLDLLIANAGVMVPPAGRTRQGFELQLGTNHLGHFALVGRLLPKLLGTPGSRVVVLSSGMHRFGRMHFDDLDFDRGYSPWGAYNQSKLANLLFVAALQRRLTDAGAPVQALAAHPGATATDLQRHGHVMHVLTRVVGMTPAQGCLPTLRAATDPAAQGGSYYGPSGPFELWGSPVTAHRARAARSEADAKRLWAVSEARTAVTYPFSGQLQASVS